MADRYQQLINTPIGKLVAGQVGLPAPIKLERYVPGMPVISGPVLLGAAAGNRLQNAAELVLAEMGAEVVTGPVGGEETFKALVFDASGIASSEQLRGLWEFFHPAIRRVRDSGRVVVLGTPPEDCRDSREATAQRALEGFIRSVGKELRRGATAQLVYAAPRAEDAIASTLRFLLSPKSAYVSGQVIRVHKAVAAFEGIDWSRPLTGKVALVTGAARGIGASIAEVLARDGAHVVGLDVPALGGELSSVMGRLAGSSLTLDITDPSAPERIANHLLGEHEGADVFVHNAGVTRDKTLGRMTEEMWSTVLGINLTAEERINDALFEHGVLRENGRICCVSSISGVAGNVGQANYATSKAGVIGMVEALAPEVAKHKVTINAVAPGFIETKMTQAMPIARREVSRRMNSLSQGGLPVDVAETIAWYASPGSAGVNGNVVRVCGQSMIGA
jgi:3-oxoacyl-[acyl-carrier protein] reductase